MSAVERVATRTLDALAISIRDEIEQAEADFLSAVGHAIRAGELLIEAKGQVKHGEWLPWLEANFTGSTRSAQGYMRLAENAEDAQRVAHLGIKGALKQITAPKETPATLDAPSSTDDIQSLAQFWRDHPPRTIEEALERERWAESGGMRASLRDQSEAHVRAAWHAGRTLLFYEQFLPRWLDSERFTFEDCARWLAVHPPELQGLMFRLLAHHFRECAHSQSDSNLAGGLRTVAAAAWLDADEFASKPADEAERFWTRMAEAFPPDVQPSPIVVQMGMADWQQARTEVEGKVRAAWEALEANAASYEAAA